MIKFSINTTPIVAVVGGETYTAWLVRDLRDRGVPEGAIVAGVKAHLSRAIDGRAEELRQSIVTPGAGQAMEYQQAQAEAFDAMADAAAGREIDPAAYPMLRAGIGLDTDPSTGELAADVLGAARAVKAAYSAWLSIGAEIRRSRLAGKASVEAAATVEAAVAAAEAIVWPAL